MTRILEKIFTQISIANIVIKTELTVLDVYPTDILEKCPRCCRIHFVFVQMYSYFEISHWKHRVTESSGTIVPFRSSYYRPRPFFGICNLRCIPCGMETSISDRHPKRCRSVIVLNTLGQAHLIWIQ